MPREKIGLYRITDKYGNYIQFCWPIRLMTTNNLTHKLIALPEIKLLKVLSHKEWRSLNGIELELFKTWSRSLGE